MSETSDTLKYPLGRQLSSLCVTWCSSCRSRYSCDSSCLLWSSSICMRASSRPLCCRRSLASANRSASSGAPLTAAAPVLDWPCCWRNCSYSLCRVLATDRQRECLYAIYEGGFLAVCLLWVWVMTVGCWARSFMFWLWKAMKKSEPTGTRSHIQPIVRQLENTAYCQTHK